MTGRRRWPGTERRTEETVVWLARKDSLGPPDALQVNSIASGKQTDVPSGQHDFFPITLGDEETQHGRKLDFVVLQRGQNPRYQGYIFQVYSKDGTELKATGAFGLLEGSKYQRVLWIET
ncbi:hypothetical protein GCM10027031_03210 [Corynebacterium atrinae]